MIPFFLWPKPSSFVAEIFTSSTSAGSACGGQCAGGVPPGQRQFSVALPQQGIDLEAPGHHWEKG